VPDRPPHVPIGGTGTTMLAAALAATELRALLEEILRETQQ
jgi:hypothetical protein